MSTPKNLKEAGPQDLKVIGELYQLFVTKLGQVLYEGKFIENKNYKNFVPVSDEHLDLVCKQWLMHRRRKKRTSTE
jgi:hypothetical protein